MGFEGGLDSDTSGDTYESYRNLTALLTVCLVLVSYLYSLWNSECRKFIKRFPGPPALPILGNIGLFKEQEELFILGPRWTKEYGNRVRLILGPTNYNLILTHPDDVKAVLTSAHSSDKSVGYKVLRFWGPSGLLVTDGEEYHRIRKLSSPGFHFKTLESFRPVFTQQSQIFVELIKERIRSGEDVIRMVTPLARYSLATIFENGMGTKVDCQRDPNEPYTAAIDVFAANICKRYERPWLHSDFLFSLSKLGRESKVNLELVHSFIDKSIADRKAQLSDQSSIHSTACKNELDTENECECDQGKRAPIIMDILLNAEKDASSGLTRENVRDQLVTFLMAGVDTTSAALFWTIMLLAENPKEQEKLQEELDTVFGPDRDKPITLAELNSLKYLDCCIKEGLRLYPSVGIMGRALTQDLELDSETVIPKGVDITIAPFFTHRLPEFFPEPLEFRPSRHLPENAVGRHPFAFIPFSAGSRSCVGQKYALASEKILLAHIFRVFKVTPVDPLETVKPIYHVTLKPKLDARCKFQLRD